MALYHDGDYKEEDAEAAVTALQAFQAQEGMTCRVLAGGKGVFDTGADSGNLSQGTRHDTPPES